MTDIAEAAAASKRRDAIFRRVQMLLVVIGLAVAGYLSYLKIEDAPAVCVESGPFNCNVVLNSLYSELAGVPIAYLGFSVYLAIGAVLLLEKRVAISAGMGRADHLRHWSLRLAVFDVAGLCAVRPAAGALPLVPQPRDQLHHSIRA